MLKLMIGVKGTGKTKHLIELVNEASSQSNGSVVCIEKGTKLTTEIKYRSRLISAEAYFIDDAQSLFGFVAGISASDHDLTDLFIDSALKICNNDLAAFDKFLDEMNMLSEKIGFNCFITSSIPENEASDTVKKYL
ncbi:MAG: hypothetical protein IJD67_06520 [Clostridia bacterium]|nr:hypothetical protein [Clostridia bacterium]